LCDTEQRQKYQQGSTVLSALESTLHQSLPEHLNSDIASGAITDIDTAHNWLRNTFLFTRVQLNPSHYHIATPSAGADWEKCFDELVETALVDLEANRLLVRSETQGIETTPFGTIAAKSYVRHESMKYFIDLPDDASKRDIVSHHRVRFLP
jgi:ATP-dependent DNA helicase HFM1/MER3